MRTSIVVPTLNTPSLPNTLVAVERERADRADVEVVVAGLDDAAACRAFPSVRFVATDGPRFPGAARNHGALAAGGDQLLFVDADCRPLPGWLRLMEQRLSAEPCAVGGGIVLEPEPYWSRVDNVALLHEYLESRPGGRRRYLASLNLGVDRRVFESAGGFDPSLRSAEDLDLTARLWRRGVPLFFEPRAAVIHRPARCSIRDLWQHHFTYGANSAAVRLRHADVLDAPAVLRSRAAMALLAPAIALVTTLRIFLVERAALPYWTTLPGVFLAKLAWCWSAALR